MTFAEKILVPLGYKFVVKNGDPFEKQVVLSIGHLKLQFDCVCPAYPTIRALGCPLHSRWPWQFLASNGSRENCDNRQIISQYFVLSRMVSPSGFFQKISKELNIKNQGQSPENDL